MESDYEAKIIELQIYLPALEKRITDARNRKDSLVSGRLEKLRDIVNKKIKVPMGILLKTEEAIKKFIKDIPSSKINAVTTNNKSPQHNASISGKESISPENTTIIKSEIKTEKITSDTNDNDDIQFIPNSDTIILLDSDSDSEPEPSKNVTPPQILPQVQMKCEQPDIEKIPSPISKEIVKVKEVNELQLDKNSTQPASPQNADTDNNKSESEAEEVLMVIDIIPRNDEIVCIDDDDDDEQDIPAPTKEKIDQIPAKLPQVQFDPSKIAESRGILHEIESQLKQLTSASQLSLSLDIGKDDSIDTFLAKSNDLSNTRAQELLEEELFGKKDKEVSMEKEKDSDKQESKVSTPTLKNLPFPLLNFGMPPVGMENLCKTSEKPAVPDGNVLVKQNNENSVSQTSKDTAIFESPKTLPSGGNIRHSFDSSNAETSSTMPSENTMSSDCQPEGENEVISEAELTKKANNRLADIIASLRKNLNQPDEKKEDSEESNKAAKKTAELFVNKVHLTEIPSFVQDMLSGNLGTEESPVDDDDEKGLIMDDAADNADISDQLLGDLDNYSFKSNSSVSDLPPGSLLQGGDDDEDSLDREISQAIAEDDGKNVDLVDIDSSDFPDVIDLSDDEEEISKAKEMEKDIGVKSGGLSVKLKRSSSNDSEKNELDMQESIQKDDLIVLGDRSPVKISKDIITPKASHQTIENAPVFLSKERDEKEVIPIKSVGEASMDSEDKIEKRTVKQLQKSSENVDINNEILDAVEKSSPSTSQKNFRTSSPKKLEVVLPEIDSFKDTSKSDQDQKEVVNNSSVSLPDTTPELVIDTSFDVTFSEKNSASIDTDASTKESHKVQGEISKELENLAENSKQIKDVCADTSISTDSIVSIDHSTDDIVCISDKDSSSVEVVLVSDGNDSNIKTLNSTEQEAMDIEIVDEINLVNSKADLSIAKSDNKIDEAAKVSKSEDISIGITGTERHESNVTSKNLLSKEEAVKIHEGVVKAQEDSVKIPEDIARLQEDTLKIQEHALKIQEDATKTQEDSSKIEDVAKLQESALKVHEHSGKEYAANTQHEVSKIQENSVIIPEDAAKIQNNAVNIQENIVKIQEDTVKMQEDTAKSQKDATKIPVVSVKSQEDATKIRADVAKIPADAAKIQEDSAKIQEDSAKIQEDSAKIQEGVGKTQEGVQVIPMEIEDIVNIQDDALKIQKDTAGSEENATEISVDAAKSQEDAAKIQEDVSKIQENTTKCPKIRIEIQEDIEKIEEDAVNIQKDAAEFQENDKKVPVGAAKTKEDAAEMPADAAKIQEDTTKIQDLVAKIQEDTVKIPKNSMEIQEDIVKIQEVAAIIHTDAAKSQKDATEIPVNAAKIQEETAKIQEDTTQIREDMAEIQEDTTQIQEDTTQIQEGTAKIQEDVSKIQEDRAKTQEDIAQIQEDAGETPTTTVEIQEDIAKIQEDAVKIQEDTVKSQEDATKILVDAVKSHEDVTKIPVDPVNIPEETAKIPENTVETQEDIAKLQDDSQNIPKETAEIIRDAAKTHENAVKLPEDTAEINEDVTSIHDDTAEFLESASCNKMKGIKTTVGEECIKAISPESNIQSVISDKKEDNNRLNLLDEELMDTEMSVDQESDEAPVIQSMNEAVETTKNQSTNLAPDIIENQRSPQLALEIESPKPDKMQTTHIPSESVDTNILDVAVCPKILDSESITDEVQLSNEIEVVPETSKPCEELKENDKEDRVVESPTSHIKPTEMVEEKESSIASLESGGQYPIKEEIIEENKATNAVSSPKIELEFSATSPENQGPSLDLEVAASQTEDQSSSVDLKVTAPETENQRTAKILEPSLQESTDILKSDLNSLVIPDTVEISAKITKSPDQDPNNALQTDENECVENVSDPIPSSSNVVSTLNENEITTQSKEKSKQIETPAINKDTDAKPVTLTLVQNLKFDETLDKDKNINDLPVLKSVDLKSPETTPNQLIQNSAGNIIKNDENLVSLNEKVAASPKPEDGLIPECEQNISKSTDEPTSHSNLLPVKKEISEPDDIDTRPGTPVLDEPDLSAICKSNECIKKLANLSKISSMDIDTSINESESFAKIPSHEGTPLRDEPNLDGNEKLPNLTELESTNTDSKIIENTELSQGTPVRDEPRITENLLSEESTRSSIIESENKETVSTSQVKTRKMSAFSEISLMKNESPTFLTESPAFLTESPTFLTESTMQVGNKVSVMQMEEVSNSSTNMEGEPKAANLAAIMQAEYHDRLRHVMTPLDASQDAIKFQTRSVETSPQDTKVVKVVASFGKAIKTAISQKPVKTDPLSSNETSKRKLEEKDNQKEITDKKDSIGSEVISKPEKSKEQATSEAASKKGKQDEHSLPPVDSNDAKEKSTKPKETERVVAAFSTNTNLKGFVSRRKELERKLSDLKDDTKLPSTSHHASETDNRNLSEVSESDCLSLSLSDISDPESGEITEKPPMPQPKVSPNEIKKEPIDRPSAPITSRLNFQSNTNKTNMPPLKITIKNEIDQDDLRARLLAKKANAASQLGEENVDRRKRHRKKNHKRKKRKVGNKEQARSPIRYVNEQGVVRNVSVDLESEFSDSSDLPEYDEPYEAYQRAKKSRIGLDRIIPTSAIKLEFNEDVQMGLECKEPLDKEIKKEYNEDDKYELQRRLRAQLAALEEELNPKPPTRQRSITPPEVYRAKTRDAESPIKLSKSPKISPRSSRSPGRSQRSPVRRSSISPSRRVRPTRRCSKSPKRRSKSPIRLTPLRRLRSPIPRVEPRRGRSRSPKIRLPIKRRSRSPRRRSRSPRRRSRSPKRRSNSPRRRSNSPRRRSNSPRRRLISPKRRSISPRHRSISSRRRSISPRRRSISPRRRSISPRRRPISPKRRSISPRRRKSISPRRRKSISPRRRSISPRRRSRSPRRSPPRRSKSPSKRPSRSPKKEHTLPKRASKSPTKSSQAANLQVSSTEFSKVIQSDLPLSQNLPSVSQVTLVELPEAVESSDTLHLPNPNLIQVPISETIENVTKPKSPPPNPNLILIPISETIEKDTKAETNLPIVCPTVIDVSDSDDDERPPASKVSAKEEEHAKTKESENTKAKEVENVKAKENETAKAKEDENAKAKEDENAKAKEDENAKVKEAEKSKVKEAEKSRAKEAENDAVGFTIEVSDDDEVIEAPPPPIISNDPKRSPKHEVTTQRPKVEATVNDEGHLVILLDDDDDDEDVVVPLKVISSKPTENQSKSAPPTEATTPSNPKLEPISSKREPFSSKGELSDEGLTDEFGSNDFGGNDFEPPSPEQNEPTAESVEALKEKDLNELHAIKIKLEREIGISEDILSQLIGNAVEKYSGVPATEYCQPNMEYYPPPNTFMMSTDFYERMQQPIAHVSPKDPRLNRMRPAPAPAPKLDEVPPPPPIPRLTPAVALPPATQPSKSLDYNDDYSDEDDLLSSGSGSLDDDDDAPRSGSSKHDKKFVMVEMSKLEEIIGQQIAKFLEANKVASKTPTKTSTSSKGNKAKKSTTPREPVEDPESPESSPEPIQTKKPRKNALSKDGSGPVHMTAEEIVSDIKKSMASLCKPKSPEKPRKGRPRSRLRNRIESSSDSDRDDASSFPSSSPPKTKISPKTKSPNVEPSALRNKITNDVAGIIKLGKANTATKVKPSPALKMAEQLTEANLLTPLREMPYDDKRKKKAEAGGSKKQKRIPKNTDMSMHCNSGEKNCLLCKEMEKNEELISHYVNVHRENEVYVARLELGQVEALTENPNLVKPVRKSNIEKYSGKCPFCSEEMSCPIGRYMEHFASHTGEFAYECDCCGTRDSRKRDLLKHCNTECEKGAKFIYVYRYDLSNKVIPAYVCIQCNYTQLNSANVIKHIRSEHDQQQVKTSDYVSITLFKVDESEPEENPKAAEEACDNIKVGNEAIAEEDDDYDAYDNFEYAPSPESDTPRPPPVGEAIEYVKNEFIMDAIDAIDWKSLEDTLTEPQELQALPVQSVTAAAPQPTVMNESLHIVPKSETLDQSIDGLKPLDIGTQIFTEIHAMATETPLRIKEISSGSDAKSGGKTKAAIIPVVENSKPPAVEEKKASTGSSSQTTTNRKVKFKGVDNSNPNITRVQSIGIEKTGLNKLKFYCFVLDCNFNPIDSLEEFRKHMRTHRHKWTGQCVACRKKGSKKFLSIDKEFLHLVNDHLPQKSYASKLLRPWIKNDPSDCYKTKDICEMLLKEFHLENLCKCMGPNCVFTTNSQKDLQFHIQLNHSEDVSALYCCYCSEHFIHTNGLVDHIGKVHGASRYQCSKCFYRSCAAYNVQMHQRTFHEDEKSLKIIVCSGQTHTFSTEMLEILDYRQRNVKPLSCPFFSACRKLVFVKHLLLDHIVKDHSRREPMDINSALYDCVYCSFGTTDLLTIRQHMANEHPSQLLYVCGLVFIKSLHPLASQTTIDITSIKSTSLVYIGDIVSKKKFIIKDQSANSFEENSIEAVNHGEDSTALNERIRQMFGEAAITFNDVESYIRKIAEGMQPDTIKTEERSELDQLVSAAIKDTGFVGKELYKCGFPKCERTFDNFEQFDRHISTHAGDKKEPIYRCPHCNRIIPTNQIRMHTIQHRRHRYLCIFCGGSSASQNLAIEHLKMSHQSQSNVFEYLTSDKDWDQKFSEQESRIFVAMPRKHDGDRIEKILEVLRKRFNPDQLADDVPAERPESPVERKEETIIPVFVSLDTRLCCNIDACPFVAKTDEELMQHISERHLIIMSGRYSCAHCPYGLSSAQLKISRIGNHLQYHGPTIVVCNMCNYYHYNRLRVLNHINMCHPYNFVTMTLHARSTNGTKMKLEILYNKKIRSPEDNYKCTLCEAILTECEDFFVHMKENHQLNVRFKCDMCPFFDNNLQAVEDHSKKTHADEPRTRIRSVFLPAGGKWVQNLSPFELLFENYEPVEQESESVKAENTVAPQATENVAKSPSRNSSNQSPVANEPEIKTEGGRKRKMNEPEVYRPGPASKKLRKSGVKRSNSSVKAPEEDSKRIKISTSPDRNTESVSANTSAVLTDTELIAALESDCTPNLAVPAASGPQMKNKEVGLIAFIRSSPKEVRHEEPTEDSAHETSAREEQPEPEVKPMLKLVPVEKLMAVRHNKGSPKAEIYNSIQPAQNNIIVSSPGLNLEISVPIGEILASKANISSPTNLNTTQPTTSVPYHTSGLAIPISPSRITELSTGDTQSSTNTSPRRMRTDVYIICFLCGAKSDSYTKLRKHFRSTHPGDVVYFRVSKKLLCAYCYTVAPFNEMKVHHFNTHVSDLFITRESNNHKKCAECSFESGSIQVLKQHVETQHSNLYVQMHSSYEFLVQSYLEDLLKVGTGQVADVIRCLGCDHIYLQESLCKNHVAKSHQNSTSVASVRVAVRRILYGCSQCWVFFETETRAIQHIRKHIEPYGCNHCEMSFSTHSLLEDHYRLYHKSKEQSYKFRNVSSNFKKFLDLQLRFSNGLVLSKLELEHTDYGQHDEFLQRIEIMEKNELRNWISRQERTEQIDTIAKIKIEIEQEADMFVRAATNE